MNDLPDRQSLQRIVQKLDPQATLLTAWQLQGGISAHMTALEIALADGQRRKVIVRQAGERALRHKPTIIEDEFRILQIVERAQVRAQRPLLLDTSGAILSTPYMVIEYIEGAIDFAPADAVHATRSQTPNHRGSALASSGMKVAQMATQLAQIHRVKASTLDLAPLSNLPRQADHLAARLQPPPVLDDSMQEGEVRAALAAFSPLPAQDERLLHGDFWPGNLLWRAGELVAVIDWEDAARGNPLEDVAIARLDISWFFGEEAMHHFSATYRAQMDEKLGDGGIDFQSLPYWDLLAALRPTGRIDEWAEGLAALGRPDMTESYMRAAHRRFVNQALAALGR